MNEEVSAVSGPASRRGPGGLQQVIDAAAHETTAVKDMQEMFDTFDDDNGGTIEADEFANHLKSGLGFDVDQPGLDSLFAEVDTSNNGHIDRDEWAEMLRSILHKLVKKPVTTDEMHRALKAMLLPDHHHEPACIHIKDIQPTFAKLGVRLTASQAQGVMLSSLGLGKNDPSAQSIPGDSASAGYGTVNGPLLDDICEALSSLLRADSFQTGATAVAQLAHNERSPAGSIALFGAPLALDMEDVDIGSNLGPLLQMVPLFADLDDEQFARLTEICERNEARYKKGDAILNQGDDGHELILLLSGTAYASIYSEDHGAKPKIVKSYSKGDYFGERALLQDDGKRAANVFVSSADAVCCKICRQEFHDLVGGVPVQSTTEIDRKLQRWRQQVSDVDAIEQWRTLVRRFLWLDMLKDVIDERRTMQGRKSHTKTEEDIRHEISKECFFFDPDGLFVSQWQLFQIPVLVVMAIVVPLRASFDQIDFENPIFWFIFDLISDVYFWFDIVLNFRTAYFDNHHHLEHSKRKVAHNYITGWFIVDFCSVLPVSYILYCLDTKSLPWRQSEPGGSSSDMLKLLKILRLFRLTKMLKLLKMKDLIQKHEENKVVERFMGSMTVVKLFVQLLYMCHFLGCFFYLFGDLSESGRPDGTVIYGWVYRQQWGAYSWTGRYLHSFFFSITDETSALAETDLELMWSGMQHIMYEAFLAYLTGVFAGEVISGNAAQQQYQSKMDQVKYFMHHYRLGHALRKDIHAFYAHLNSAKTFFDEEAVINELPPAIRKKVIYHIHKNIVDNREVKNCYPFLSRLPERLRYELCRALKPVPAARGDVIYEEGAYGEEMYLMDTGQCAAYKWTGDTAEDNKQKLNERKKTVYAGVQLDEGLTLHVRGIGGPTADPGVYEDPEALRAIFEEYGKFGDAVIRHRVDERSGKNTSWALVTMCDAESAARVLEAAATVGVLRPDGVELKVSPYSAKTASNSTGAMQRTTNAIQTMDSRAHEVMDEERDQHTNLGMHGDYGELVSSFSDGSFFGEEALLGENIKRIATVVAIAEVSHIWYLDRASVSSFSRQEDVYLFYKELRSFKRKRQHLNEVRAKRMAKLDKRLKSLRQQSSLAQMLAGGGLPAGARIPTTKELPMIDAVFSSRVIYVVRNAIKFRCVALDFEKGDALHSVASEETTTVKNVLEGGIFVLVSGELSASEAADLDRPPQSAGNLSPTNSSAKRISLQPGYIFSGSASVKKVKKCQPGDRLLAHPQGMHVREAVVESDRASALWLDCRMFDFAYHPNSLEVTIGEYNDLDDESDEPDDTEGQEVSPDATSRSTQATLHQLQTQIHELKHHVNEKVQRLEQANANMQQANANMQQEVNSKLDMLLAVVAPPSALHKSSRSERKEPALIQETDEMPVPEATPDNQTAKNRRARANRRARDRAKLKSHVIDTITNHTQLPLDRIHNMLKLYPYGENATNEETKQIDLPALALDSIECPQW